MQQKRKKINYPLIVSDFDGTLVNEDTTISPINIQFINEYIAAGGNFAISTGRMPKSILRRAKELGLHGVISCCQGGIIMDIQTEEVLFSDTIPNNVAVKICKRLEEMDLHIQMYGLWSYYCNRDNEPLKYYESITKDIAIRYLEKPLSTLLEESKMDVYKFLVMVRKEDNAKLFTALEKENFPGCVITKSGDFLVEVISERTSKGTAIAFLADYYNVPIEKTIGIGDQWNDISMIETAGIGIAVKNADEKLKASADVVLEYTNEEGAVGRVIEAYGLKE